MENQIQALLSAGYEVDVFCLRGEGQPRQEVVNGATVYRANVLPRKRGGQLRYLAEYASFWFATLFFLTRRQVTHGYDIITVQTLPDFLSFAAVFAKLLGAKVIVDMRECMPEMYQSTFDVGVDHPMMKAVIAAEQGSIGFADAALTCTAQMRDAFAERGASASKIGVMLNVADPALYRDPVLPDVTAGNHNPFRIVTHGTIKERYGHEVLIQAMARVIAELPSARLDVLGDGPMRPELERMVDELGLKGVVTFTGYVPDDELMRRLRSAECGVVPLIRTPETDLVHTFKMYEYIAMGLPVIISRTRAVEAYFDESMVCYFPPGDVEGLANAIITLGRDPGLRYALARNALDWYEKHGPAQQREEFLKVVRAVIGERLPAW